MGCNEFVVLLGTGVASIAVAAAPRRPHHTVALVLPSLALAAGSPAGVRQIEPISLLWVFAKIGSVLFGSGYVLLAFLRAELVDRLGWLNESQLIDAVAIGQVTPGPVFTTATFVGYLVGGTTGPAAATVGIFLPAFVFVALGIPLLARLRSSWTVSAFLDGVKVASVVPMALVTLQLGRAAILDVPTTLLALASVALLLRGVNSSWLIGGGCVVGWVMRA